MSSILVAFNFAERFHHQKQTMAKVACTSFHEEMALSSDNRLRDACGGTPLWGAYITDFIKFDEGQLSPLRESKPVKVAAFLNRKQYGEEQVAGLIDELKELGCTNPKIVALGSDVFKALDRSDSIEMLKAGLGEGAKVYRVTLYSKVPASEPMIMVLE
ncbi:hypothetical protein CDES_06285 [Corynebacterium deserti GIMN1.010]|uniref:Uncharacterized protein n=1 Tax=Corynebacterium deserti GIMN1.010 TaxID=931089 RepID=A0A0M4CPM1_9CORY|nr:hypothetical protein [Corynebacterium deserti]ALC05680.1 hypothetical protein CDES_06285 [Corynebacterium deserti GIMN1.010]